MEFITSTGPVPVPGNPYPITVHTTGSAGSTYTITVSYPPVSEWPLVMATGPTVVLLLSRLGIVTARFMLRHFKYAVLIIFILAAVITPDGNPINQVVMAGPMIGLYVFSILLAAIFGKKRRLPDEA